MDLTLTPHAGGALTGTAGEEGGYGDIGTDHTQYAARQFKLHEAAANRHVHCDAYTVHDGLKKYHDALNEYCHDDTMNESRPPLVFVGEVGSGKSSLLVNWMRNRQRRSKGSTQEFIFLHMGGCSRDSTTVSNLLFRIVTEIKHRFGLHMEISERETKLSWEFIRALDTASKKGRVIIIIDSLNRLHSESFAGLKWLPLHFPPNVRVIISTTASAKELAQCQDAERAGVFFLTQSMNEPEASKPPRARDRTLAEIVRRGWPIVQLEWLDRNNRAAIVQHFLRRQSDTQDSGTPPPPSPVSEAGLFMDRLLASSPVPGAQPEAVDAPSRAHGDALEGSFESVEAEEIVDPGHMPVFVLLPEQQQRIIDCKACRSPQFLRVLLETLRLAACEQMDVCAILEDCIAANNLRELYEVILRRWTRGCVLTTVEKLALPPPEVQDTGPSTPQFTSFSDDPPAAAAVSVEFKSAELAATERRESAQSFEFGQLSAIEMLGTEVGPTESTVLEADQDQRHEGKERDPAQSPAATPERLAQRDADEVPNSPGYSPDFVVAAGQSPEPLTAHTSGAGLHEVSEMRLEPVPPPMVIVSAPNSPVITVSRPASRAERADSRGSSSRSPSQRASAPTSPALHGQDLAKNLMSPTSRRRSQKAAPHRAASAAAGKAAKAAERELQAETARLTAMAQGAPAYLCGGESVLGLGPALGAALCFLYASRHGLMEEELQRLLTAEVRISNQSCMSVNDPQLFARLRTLLQVLGASAVGPMFMLPPLCSTLRGLVHRRYLSNGSGLWRVQQALSTFHHQAPVTTRRAEELPWLLERRENWTGLKDSLLDLKMFEILWTPTHKFDLFRYWGLLTGASSDQDGGDRGGFGGGAGSDNDGGDEPEQSVMPDTTDGRSVSDGAGRRSVTGTGRKAAKRTARSAVAAGLNQTRIDIVDEYNKAVESWYYAVRPSAAELNRVLTLIEDFLYNFGEQEGNTPEFLHRPLSDVALQTLGIQLRSRAPARSGVPSDPISLTHPHPGHYYYRRWVWIQFPWIALGNVDAVLKQQAAQQAEQGAKDNRSRSPTVGNRVTWQLQQSQLNDGKARPESSSGDMTLKVSSSMRSVFGPLSSPTKTALEADITREDHVNRRKVVHSILGTPGFGRRATPDGTKSKGKSNPSSRPDTVSSSASAPNLPPNVIPFSNPSVKAQRAGTKFPTVEAAAREEPGGSGPIFHGGIVSKKEAPSMNTTHSFTTTHNFHRPVHVQEYPVTELEVEVAQAQTKLATLRRHYDRLSFVASTRERELAALSQQLQERDELEEFNRKCIEEGQSTMADLEKNLESLAQATSQAESVQAFYRRVLELCDTCPANDPHHMSRVERNVETCRLELADKRAQLKSLSFELKHMVRYEKPALEAEIARSTKMRRSIIAKLKEQRERQDKTRLEAVKRARRRQDIANQVAGDLSSAQEVRLKALTMRQQQYEQQLKSAAEYQRQRIQEYQDAFRRIRSATGITDPSELYNKFIGRESAIDALNEQRVAYESRLGKLRVELKQAQEELESLQFGDSAVTSRFIRQVDEETVKAETEMNTSREKYGFLCGILKDVKAGAVHLAHLVGYTEEDLSQVFGQGNSSTTGAAAAIVMSPPGALFGRGASPGLKDEHSADVVQLLEMVEQRVNHMISKLAERAMYEAVAVGKPGAKRNLANLRRQTSTRDPGDTPSGAAAGTLMFSGEDAEGGDADAAQQRGDGAEDQGSGAQAPPSPTGSPAMFSMEGLGLAVNSSGHLAASSLRQPSAAQNIFVPSARNRKAREMAQAMAADSDSDEEGPAGHLSLFGSERRQSAGTGIQVPPVMASMDPVDTMTYVGQGFGVTMQSPKPQTAPTARPKKSLALPPGTIEAVTSSDVVASREQMKQLSRAVGSKYFRKKRAARPKTSTAND